MSDSEDLLPEVNANKLRDVDLCFFTHIANIENIGVVLTIFVKGNLFSGELISGSEFYKKSAEKYSSSKEDSVGELVKQHFEYRIEAYADLYKEPEKALSQLEITFLHLKDVSMYTGGGHIQSIEGGLLRLKIEEIDGYILGKMSTK